METDGWEAKAWGRVRHVFVTPGVAISFLEVTAGTRSSWHRHSDRHNTFHVGSGRVLVEYEPPAHGGELACWPLKAGEAFTVPAGVLHRFRVVESGALVEVYWPREPGVAVRQDDIERLDEGGVDDNHDQHRSEVFGG